MRIKKWFRDWLFRDDSDTIDMEKAAEQERMHMRMNMHNGSKAVRIGSGWATDEPASFDVEGLNITLYNANGGHVVSMRSYDRKTDRNSSNLYLITSDQKFEEALAQCIAMECLSR